MTDAEIEDAANVALLQSTAHASGAEGERDRIKAVVALRVEELRERLKTQAGLAAVFTSAAIEELKSLALDPEPFTGFFPEDRS